MANGSGNGALEIVYIEWHITPFRAERWYEIWEAAAARAMSFGAKGWSLTRYWYSDEIAALRQEAVNYYAKPVLPVWHTLIAGE